MGQKSLEMKSYGSDTIYRKMNGNMRFMAALVLVVSFGGRVQAAPISIETVLLDAGRAFDGGARRSVSGSAVLSGVAARQVPQVSVIPKSHAGIPQEEPGFELVAIGDGDDKRRVTGLFAAYQDTLVGRQRLEAIRRCYQGPIRVGLEEFPMSSVQGAAASLAGGSYDHKTRTIVLERRVTGVPETIMGRMAHEMQHAYHQACFPQVSLTKEHESAARMEQLRMVREMQGRSEKGIRIPISVGTGFLGGVSFFLDNSIPVAVAALVGVAAGMLLASVLLGGLIGIGIFLAYLAVTQLPFMGPVAGALEHAAAPINFAQASYRSGKVADALEYERDAVAAAKRQVETFGSYDRLPKTQDAIENARRDEAFYCRELGDDPQRCQESKDSLSGLRRWRQHIGAYEQTVIEELERRHRAR